MDVTVILFYDSVNYLFVIMHWEWETSFAYGLLDTTSYC